MNKIMGFDWAKADKTIKDIESLLKDYEGEARIQLLERANYFLSMNKRAQCGILDEYREHDAREIARIILPILCDKDGNPYATRENIEDILDKIFNKDESQE